MRLEFSKATKKAAWERCRGLCEAMWCGQPISERPEYHHIVEAALGGDNELSNCLVLHKKCHAVLTCGQSIPRVAKVMRIRNKRRGIERKRQIMPGSRASKYKRTMRGETVLRGDWDS